MCVCVCVCTLKKEEIERDREQETERAKENSCVGQYSCVQVSVCVRERERKCPVSVLLSSSYVGH